MHLKPNQSKLHPSRALRCRNSSGDTALCVPGPVPGHSHTPAHAILIQLLPPYFTDGETKAQRAKAVSSPVTLLLSSGAWSLELGSLLPSATWAHGHSRFCPQPHSAQVLPLQTEGLAFHSREAEAQAARSVSVRQTSLSVRQGTATLPHD